MQGLRVVFTQVYPILAPEHIITLKSYYLSFIVIPNKLAVIFGKKSAIDPQDPYIYIRYLGGLISYDRISNIFEMMSYLS